jgi:hypothetical protein
MLYFILCYYSIYLDSYIYVNFPTVDHSISESANFNSCCCAWSCTVFDVSSDLQKLSRNSIPFWNAKLYYIYNAIREMKESITLYKYKNWLHLIEFGMYTTFVSSALRSLRRIKQSHLSFFPFLLIFPLGNAPGDTTSTFLQFVANAGTVIYGTWLNS